MPVFAQPFERQSTARSRIQEIRNVMHKRLDFDNLPAMAKSSLFPFVLFERMKFDDKELAVRLQNPRGLGKDMGQVLDVFQHEVAGYEVVGLIFTRPSFCQVCR